MEAMINDWWSWARRRRRTIWDPWQELWNLVQSGDTSIPSDDLEDWLSSYGREHGPLTVDEAKRWLVTASQVERSVAATRLTPLQRGADARRPPVPEKYRVGEVLFKPRFVSNKMRADDGSLVSDPDGIDDLLWNSRRALWGSYACCPNTALKVISHYMRGRGLVLPPTFIPDIFCWHALFLSLVSLRLVSTAELTWYISLVYTLLRCCLGRLIIVPSVMTLCLTTFLGRPLIS